MLYPVSLRGMGLVLGFATILSLAGCGSGVVPAASLPGGSNGSGSGSGGTPPPQGVTLTGMIQGGQKPIVGSNIYLYAVGTTGYSKGAVSLLSGNGYVVSDAKGSFSIPGNFSCPSSGTLVYLIAVGGDAGSGTNSRSVLMSAMGTCGGLQANTPININEVTTVASVYALGQFMTPGATDVGTSSSNVTGLTNAFQTAANLADFYAGTSRSATLASNGTVPQSTINTLANIMAACVNTNGNAGACSALFTAATPSGGTAPTDTLAAMLDIALHPGHNVSTLYGIIPAVAAFHPSLAGAPNDWTLSIEYTGGGLNYGQLLAVDGQGNIWVPNAIDPGTLSEFSPTGAALSGNAGYSGGGLSYPQCVAIDNSGNAWAANEGNDSISEHSSNGTPLSGSGYTAQGLHKPFALAIDGSGNVFTANSNDSVTKLNSAGSAVGQFINGGLDYPFAIAVDASQNIWVANYGVGNSVSKFSNGGTPAALTGFTGGGINGAVGVAVDANSNVWVANFNTTSTSELNNTGSPLSGAGYSTPADVSAVAVDGSNTVWTANADGSISHLASNGTPISPSTGYVSAGATGEVGIAIDASGNVWTTDNYVNSLFEYVGVASPAVVPLQQAVKSNLIGQRP